MKHPCRMVVPSVVPYILFKHLSHDPGAMLRDEPPGPGTSALL